MTKTPVAIVGVSPLSLILGRACSLSDAPIVGIYDPDHSKALRASLLLGTSALDAPAKVMNWGQSPGVLLLSNPDLINFGEVLTDSKERAGFRLLFALHLYSRPARFNEHTWPQCWLESVTPSPVYDETVISSQVQPLTFVLEGLGESQATAKKWLEAISREFTISRQDS